MRILAFSDLHCDREAAQNIVTESATADVVVGAGDFGIRGERSTELLDILKDISKPVLLVSGNHDRRVELAEYCSSLTSSNGSNDHLHLLDGSSRTIDGVTFFGLGGEIPSRSDAHWNETIEEDAATKILQSATHFDVLITHTPPYGYCDLQKDGTHEGSEAITNAIKRSSPTLCLCGHIHHAWGSVAQLDATTVHNLGPKPCWHTLSDPG